MENKKELKRIVEEVISLRKEMNEVKLKELYDTFTPGERTIIYDLVTRTIYGKEIYEDTFIVEDVIWSEEQESLLNALKRFEINTLYITDGSTALKTTLLYFLNNGFELVGIDKDAFILKLKGDK